MCETTVELIKCERSSSLIAELSAKLTEGRAVQRVDGTFSGLRPVIRQDMAAFLHRMHDNVLKRCSKFLLRLRERRLGADGSALIRPFLLLSSVLG